MPVALDYDYLIVGQGIAGSTLAWTLTQRGCKVLIVSNSAAVSASKVSAGIFNPLTGKKISLTWRADDIFPFAMNFYRNIEKTFDVELLHLSNIYRPFRSIEEQNSYLARTAEPQIAKYIKQHPDDSKFAENIENPFGGLEVTQSGWVEVARMLDFIMSFYIEKRQYIDSIFDFKNIDIQKDSVFYQNYKIKKIIFCEGFQLRENPFFNWLPFSPVKGEILTAQINNYFLDTIVNQGVWVLPPNDQGLCRIGATYEWQNLDYEPTAAARTEIEQKARMFLKEEMLVTSQVAGVRPSSPDRRPLIGQHPTLPQLAIFNGLGTKGVSLAPYFANQLADFLISNKELDPAVNIQRYFSLYFRK